MRQTAARLTVPEMYVFTYWKNPYHRTAGMEPLSVAACSEGGLFYMIRVCRVPLYKGGVGKKDLSVVSPESSGIKMISNICPETELTDKRNATSDGGREPSLGNPQASRAPRW